MVSSPYLLHATVIVAAKACDPSPAGTTSEPLIREADSPRPAGTTSEPLVRETDSSDGDVERYQVPGENDVMPSGGCCFWGLCGCSRSAPASRFPGTNN